jgi:DNA-binding CsgD family transcriptional regulator
MAEWGTFAHAAALFDVGRPDLALELIDRPRPHTEPGDLDRYVEGIRGLSLMALGRFEEAHDWEHDLLARAYDDLDALGIRVHACVLAEVLARSGHTEQAWHILSTSLRLGPAGPIETTFYRRSLALGAVLCAAAGDPLVARSLAQALTARPAGAAALLQTPSALALVAASPADAAAAEVLLWEHGLAHLEAGRLLPALICWLSGPGPRSTDQMRQIRALRERVHVPALDPAFAHLEALERGDAEAAAALQPQVRELMLWVDPSAPPRARVPRGDRGRVAGALTAREREVVRLYRSGMSAAQIAERLDVSTRTAENHIYRARHKLGATDGSWPWDGLSGGE